MRKIFYVVLAALLTVCVTDFAFADKKWSGYGSSSESQAASDQTQQTIQLAQANTYRSTGSATDDEVKEAVRKYVRERRYRGAITYNDAGKTRRLEMTGFGNTQIIRSGNSFTVTANFTDTKSGENVLMDFEVASNRDGLSVTKIKLQPGSSKSSASSSQNTYRSPTTEQKTTTYQPEPEKKKGWW